MRHLQGIGLFEVLVALFLSSFIMIILMSQYLIAKKQYHHLQTNLEQRIDLQLVSEFMRESIRNAGFTPCLSIDSLVSVDLRDKPKPLVAIDLSADHHEQFGINRMSGQFDSLLEIENPMQLFITATEPLYPNESILIADCYHAEVQALREVVHLSHNQRIRLSKPLAFRYQEPIYVGPWLEERYFIRRDKVGRPSLFFKAQRAEELTSAVHSLSVQLTQYHGHSLVKIRLGLNNGPAMVLETRIRQT